MANTTYDTIKNMKPAPWSKSTVADGNALNQNFLEPTHQKDLALATAIDQVKNTVDGYNETINNISNVADVAKTQATNAISAANEAQDDVEEMSDAVAEHGESIETLDNNFNTLSAAVAGEAEAITNLQNNKQDKIYVDANTISGNGTENSPYTVIGGNQKELEFVDSTTVTVHKDEQDDKIIYSFSAAGGGGGGTSYDMAWYPTVAADGKIEWAWNPTTSAPPTANIKGPKGEDGPTGPDGKTPVLSANSYNLYWKYSDATSGWTNLGNFRGEQGETPHIDSTNKHWYIGEVDTGIVAEGKDGKDGTNGTNGTNGADACPISAKSTEITNGHNVKIFYTSAANPDTNPLANFNVMNGQGSSDVFDNTTISGTGASDDPYGVNTDVLATHTWVENQHYIANVTVNTTAFSGDGTSQNPLDLKINNPDSNKKYGYQPGTGWTEISEGGGGTDYDIIGNNGISAKKDTDNDRYEVGLSANYLQTVSATGVISGDGTSGSPLGLKAEVSEQLSKIEYKSTVTSGAGHNLSFKDGTDSNPITNFDFSAVDYMRNLSVTAYAPQRLVVVTGDNDIINNHATYSEGIYGTIFFVTSAHA